jgi:hypothetical protein
MIYTQTMRDLGHPPWIPRGAYILEVDGPEDKQGYGLPTNEAMRHANEELHKVESDHACLVNAKIEIRNGRGHESYGKYKLRIIGDLYLKQV